MPRTRQRPRLNRMPRILVAVMMLAFCFATTVYAAHVHEKTVRSGAVTHCEVCLHLSGTAGAPAPPSLAGFAPVVTFEAIAWPVQVFVSAHRPRAHRSRAPPSPSR